MTNFVKPLGLAVILLSGCLPTETEQKAEKEEQFNLLTGIVSQVKVDPTFKNVRYRIETTRGPKIIEIVHSKGIRHIGEDMITLYLREGDRMILPLDKIEDQLGDGRFYRADIINLLKVNKNPGPGYTNISGRQ